MSDDFDLKGFSQPARPDKIRAVNELGTQTAHAVLEMSRRMDLRSDEVAWALLGAVGIILRNRGGPNRLSRNLRTFAGKLHEYATMLDRRDAQPTDEILPH